MANASIIQPLNPGNKGAGGGICRERGPPDEGAVVVTVTVTVEAELPTASGFGETVQVDSAGAPTQAKLMDPVSPPTGPVKRSKECFRPA